jgi:hypothetical protein
MFYFIFINFTKIMYKLVISQQDGCRTCEDLEPAFEDSRSITIQDDEDTTRLLRADRKVSWKTRKKVLLEQPLPPENNGTNGKKEQPAPPESRGRTPTKV